MGFVIDTVKERPARVNTFFSFFHWLVWLAARPVVIVACEMGKLSARLKELWIDGRPDFQGFWGPFNAVFWRLRYCLVAPLCILAFTIMWGHLLLIILFALLGLAFVAWRIWSIFFWASIFIN